jgi:hypothetical protein
MALASGGMQIKSSPKNCPHCFQIHGWIYHLVSPLCPNGANKPGYGLLYTRIFGSAEAKTNQTKGV